MSAGAAPSPPRGRGPGKRRLPPWIEDWGKKLGSPAWWKGRPQWIASNGTVVLANLAAVVTIGGIVLAFWQFYATKQDGRVTATLGYVARLSSSPVWDSFRNIYVAWDRDGHGILHGDADAIRQQKIAFIAAHDLGMDAVIVGDYFDQVYICVRERICDLALTMTMLGRDIEIAYVYAGRYLDDARARRGGNTGCGLAALYWLAGDRLQYDRLPEQVRRATPPPRMKLTYHACPME